jgi:hypothetical protein
MAIIGLILSFVTLPTSLFFTVASVNNGNIVHKIFARLSGIGGVVLSIIYILKYYNLI